MSTKKLLGGSQAREGAKRRRRVVQEMDRMTRMYQPGSPQAFRIESLAATLREVHHDGRFTDAHKDAKFTALLNRKR